MRESRGRGGDSACIYEIRFTGIRASEMVHLTHVPILTDSRFDEARTSQGRDQSLWLTEYPRHDKANGPNDCLLTSQRQRGWVRNQTKRPQKPRAQRSGPLKG